MPWFLLPHGPVSSQDLRDAALHRVLTVLKGLDLLAAERAHLQALVGAGLTAQVRGGGSSGGRGHSPDVQVLLWFQAGRHVIVSEQTDPAEVEELSEAFYDLFMVRQDRARQVESKT